jgi:hypothetical protein
MYLINDKLNKKDINILIGLETKIGFVSASLKVNGNKLSATFSAETREATEFLEKHTKFLAEQAESAGFSLSSVAFEKNENVNFFNQALKG